MDLLTAVNRILPKLGEHPVTSLQSKSPTLAILLSTITDKIKECTMQGWWFNERRATLPLNTTNEIEVGTDALSFVPDCNEACIRKHRLFNTADNTFKWTLPVSGKMVVLVPFDELPESVASFVYYNVLVESCVTDIGMTTEVQEWMRERALASARMLSEHLKNKKYSTTKSRSFRHIRRAMSA